MFEVLVYMFENYFSSQALPEETIIEQELAEAGFDQSDISGAFDWFKQLKTMMEQPVEAQTEYLQCSRIFTDTELRKIHPEGLGFILFLEQAKVINSTERDLIMDRAMALTEHEVSLEEIRWITMLALWTDGREKDYLFVEDAIFNPREHTIQ